MPRLNAETRSALGYWWNLVIDAAQEGLTTTETTQLANQVARDLGGTLSLADNRAIATLYGYARRMDNASSAFQNADPDAIITPDMVATPPYARDDQEQRAYPNYHVKFFYTYIDQAGNEHTTVKTSAIPFTIGPTVEDVAADVQADAIGFAAKYGHTLVSAIAFQILAV